MFSDLRYALRLLRKNLIFSTVSILALALGIGANTAIFSLVNAVLLRQLPFRDPGRLVWIWSTRTDLDKAFFSILDFLECREQNRTLEDIAAFANWGANLTGVGEPERFQGVRLSANALAMLGVTAKLGRALVPSDENPSSDHVVMLSHGLWQRRFGEDPSVIGRSIDLNGEPYRVVGVLPPEFLIPNAETEVAVPLVFATDSHRGDRGSNFLRAFARLKPGVTLQQAQADLTSIIFRIRTQYPVTNGKHTAPRVLRLADEISGGYHAALLMLLGAVGVLLLIACANLANLLLARATARQRETAIRAALGASRSRLLRQFLTESMVLSFAGGALGLLLATWGTRLLAALSPTDLPRASAVAVDSHVLAFTFGVSAVTGLLCGLAPALQASKTDLRGGEGTRIVQAGGTPLRNALVVAEVALSLVLLIGAGLMVKSFLRLAAVSPGFPTGNLLLVRLSLPKARYTSHTEVSTFYQRLAERVQAIPGVVSVSLANVLPLSAMNVRLDFAIAGQEAASRAEIPAAQNRWIAPGYFGTLGIPVRRGREFTLADRATTQPVVMVDEALARRFFRHRDPLGAHLRFGGREFEIVGVVADVKHNGLTDTPTPTLYAPLDQIDEDGLSFLVGGASLAVRTGIEPMAIAPAVRRELHTIDPNIPASNVRTMDQFVAASIAPRRFNLILLAVFAGAALLLAASGLYAVVSHAVTQRTREIGIRIALGARPRSVLQLVVGGALRLVMAGLALGVVAGLALARLLTTLLYDVSPSDKATLGWTSLLLAVAGLCAGYLPARRATKVDPLEALRGE